MLTIKDIQKLMETFATKYDLEKLVHRDEFDEKFNMVLTRLDAVYNSFTVASSAYKELVDMRMDNATHMQSHRDIEEDLSKIKSIPIIAHELKKSK